MFPSDDDIETEDHLFALCSVAKDVWKEVMTWWKVSGVLVTSVDDAALLSDRVLILPKLKKPFDVAVNTTLWHLCNLETMQYSRPNCGVTHEPYQCQPKNHDYYHEQNSCYDSNSFGFDHGQPPRYTVNHPIFNVHNYILTSLTMIVKQMTQLTSMCEMFCQFVQKKREEKRIEEEQAAKAQNWKLPVCYDADDDEERSNSLQDNIIFGLPPCFAITPNEPVDSLSTGDEHLNTIPAIESDEFIKSCVENIVPNPSESEGE
uniref:RNA-directed DNA polymerase, eukaryota, reverse transcriptase zinc-binding domain protein n=1 Tax=Tanacetum cinerariifolium TaxID=118510 RepID=A0A6L2JHM5_TANCI|nr:RNA-directed DNA polymerase, eukaryota, reverse transcriptase zinc-binding domain protein [Tanacetum cinerariifolium]